MLDKWTPDQVLNMMVGGNAKADAFFKKRGWTEAGTDKLQAKYTSKAATMYKEHLETEVEYATPVLALARWRFSPILAGNRVPLCCPPSCRARLSLSAWLELALLM